MRSLVGFVCVLATALPLAAAAQPAIDDDQHQHGAAEDRGWTFGFDGVVFGTLDRQGGLRGGTQFRSQNWFMGMASRDAAGGRVTLTGMLSAEPFTVGPAGYLEIFQEGEAYHNLQVTDRQHPHDFFTQLAAAWRRPIGGGLAITVAGGPVGEPALGPVAYVHRASSAENPTAPLSHHIFDSTHVTEGVITAGVDRGPIDLEASIFRGREPDEHRYDIELGALDSWSVRVTARPTGRWLLQASYGFLHEPEQLEPGDQRRTNGSVSWMAERPSGFTAVTIAIGQNARTFSTVHALLAEATHRAGRTSVYGRYEALTVETEILLRPQLLHVPHPGELVDPIQAATAGVVRDVAARRGFAIGIGGDATLYRVPELLQITHGAHPISFHAFVRIRLRAAAMQHQGI